MDAEGRATCKQNEDFLDAIFGDVYEHRPAALRRRQRVKAAPTLTEQSLRLREASLRFDYDELSRLYPCFDRTKGRVTDPLSRQPLGPKSRFGLQVGARRG